MADLPSANTTVSDVAGAAAIGTDLCVVIAACALNADAVPRIYSNISSLLENHLYCDGADYCAMHFEETGKPIQFVPLPIVTEGVVGRINTSGNSGTSVVTVAALTGGSRGEHEGKVTVVRGGLIGTDQIMLGISLDGGRRTKRGRLGTANSYTISDLNVQLNFGAGTLVTGDVIVTWSGTAPRWDQAGLIAARTALAAQQKQARTWHVIGDLLVVGDANDVVTQVNAYETTHDRFTVARASVLDRLPQAELSHVVAKMVAGTSLTFAEVGGTGDTITRATGSWLADGFAIGDTIVITGTDDNNITAVIANLSATVITLGGEDLEPEVTANATVVGYPTLTFAEVGGTGDTITRNRGSWLADGFRIGDKIVVAGTASNNITAAAGLTNVTATVLTLDDDDLAAEVIGVSSGVTVTAGQTKAQHIAAADSTFGSVDAQKRVSLGIGRGFKVSPILGYEFRRPAQWFASIREYQHDVHIPTWRKDDGPLLGVSLEDTGGNLVEHDERVDGGALAGRFTCLRTWGNGPRGAFVAHDLTRATDNTLLSRTHNMHVANVACTVVQAETEGFLGQTPTLNADGTATATSLAKLKARVDSALQRNLLQDKRNEGPRASACEYNPNPDSVLNVVPATLAGVTELNLLGTLEQVRTDVRVS